tara:strand:+ start:11188 stop:12333 length:1146 start_codon:yes stop_codon:yes gene_type:complete
MDYTKESISFKLQKTLRYLKLYGPIRTYIKIKGQYHMNKSFDVMPQNKLKKSNKKHVGILGCGNYSYSVLSHYLKKNYGKVIRGAMDIEINRSASIFKDFGLDYYTDNPREIIDDSQIDLIFIASNHYTHAEYAIEALDNGKSVHIEKPHVVNQSQLERLILSMKRSKGKVRVGFNRPASKFGKLILEYLNNEEGSTMINWFVAGHEINPDHWYFHDKEGGRILGNLCHWTDFCYRMISEEDRYPIRIIPSRSEKADCDISVTYVFGDGSIATITFSAKGHTFEGVREKLNLHKGNTLISMDDYETMRVDVIDKKKVYKNIFRDHGHELSIKESYDLVTKNNKGESTKYIYETADLFLRTKDALETQKEIIIKPYEESPLF